MTIMLLMMMMMMMIYGFNYLHIYLADFLKTNLTKFAVV